MDDNENRSLLESEREIEARKLRKKKARELSSTDAPPKYWAQGKVFFISNGAGTAFYHGDSNDMEFDYVTDLPANASIYTSVKEANKVLAVVADWERGDFPKGRDGLKLFNLFQDAKVAVLVFKCRDVRVPTHLQKGD